MVNGGDARADGLTDRVITCIIRVHRALGPGFMEAVYHRAMIVELNRQRLRFESERKVAIYYEGTQVGAHRIDLIVEDRLVLELKAVTSLHPVFYAQLRSYLHATGLDTGLLVNFSAARADFRRVQRP